MRGWRGVYVVLDATRAVDPAMTAATVAQLRRAGVQVVNATEAVAIARGRLDGRQRGPAVAEMPRSKRAEALGVCTLNQA